MITVFLIYGSRTHPLSWILFMVYHVMIPLLFFSQYAMTNPGTIMFCFPQRVVPLLVFNGVAGFLIETLSRLAGNPRHIFTILLGFSPLITFVLFLYLARCTSMIATQGRIQHSIETPAYASLSSQPEKSLARALFTIFILTKRRSQHGLHGKSSIFFEEGQHSKEP